MKKHLLIIALCACSGLKAQLVYTKGYLGVSLGGSFPAGDFGSKDIGNTKAGYATNGYTLDINFAQTLGKGRFGYMFMLRGQSMPFDAQALADDLANRIPNVYFKVESKGWRSAMLLLGGFGTFPASTKASFDARAMVGLISSSSPMVDLTGTGPGGTAWIKQSSVDAVALAFLIGAGFKFKLNEDLFMLANLDYLISKPEFRNIEFTNSAGDKSVSTLSQPMESITLSIGLGFVL